jgi:phosphoglycolate phosphatase
MKYDSIIFDLDGTLWDASSASAEGWNIALQNLGIDVMITGDDIKSISGKPYRECMEILLPDIDPESDVFYDELNRQEKVIIEKKGGILYDSVHGCLEVLSESYKLFIISNCEGWYLDEFFRFSEVKKYFSGYDCHGKSNKTKKEMIQEMAKKQGLYRPVYVGDTDGDHKSASDAGIDFIHIRHGFGKPASIPCMAFENFKELSDFFLK